MQVIFVLLLSFLCGITQAQTWQKVLTLPTVTAGDACTPTGAIGADTAGTVYSCKSGVWTAISSGGAGSTTPITMLKGKTVSCPVLSSDGSIWAMTAMGMVDASGNTFRRIRWNDGTGDTGWIAGVSGPITFSYSGFSIPFSSVTLTLAGINATGSICIMNCSTVTCKGDWPLF